MRLARGGARPRQRRPAGGTTSSRARRLGCSPASGRRNAGRAGSSARRHARDARAHLAPRRRRTRCPIPARSRMPWARRGNRASSLGCRGHLRNPLHLGNHRRAEGGVLPSGPERLVGHQRCGTARHHPGGRPLHLLAPLPHECAQRAVPRPERRRLARCRGAVLRLAILGAGGDSQATLTYLLGVMVQILADRPGQPTDSEHSVRRALAPGTAGKLIVPFKERFGVDLVDAYGATETNAAIVAGPGAPSGSMGRVVPGFHARVVDENDVEVPDGTPGELVLRPDEPFSFATGYFRNPEATVEVWRNLWHHTGDQVVRDAEGWFVFKQRLNDRIRRRGENVSAWEVEQALESHPAVGLAAVIGVPSELGEEDVMAFVVPSDGMRVDPSELIESLPTSACAVRVAAVRRDRGGATLTTTGKVEKYRLRAQLPTTATTWDRDAVAVQPTSAAKGSRS